MKKILMFLTTADMMPNNEATGVWLSEFAEPYDALIETGHQITIASIKGGKIPVDPKSLGELANESKYLDLIKDSEPLTSINSQDYAGIFFPGGHGTMFDFPFDTQLASLIAEFYETTKPIAAVCHGPAALVNVKLSDGSYLVNNKTVTSFTNAEEAAIELTSVVPFLLETKFIEHGANFVPKANFEAHVEVDGLLVTGQNPQSSIITAQKFVELLTN